MPPLSPDDERLFNLFTLCDSQLRAGFGGAYALDWAIVLRAADDHGIATGEDFYQMLRVFEQTMLAARNKKVISDQ